MSVILALLLQIGPNPNPSVNPTAPFPPEMLNRRPRPAPVQAPPEPQMPSLLRACLDTVASDPAAGLARSGQWLESAAGTDKALALRCRGSALAAMGHWDDAGATFLAARDATPAANGAGRARLGAMAGNASLAKGAPNLAMGDFDKARADALAVGDKQLAGDIQVDRSRALVALGREDEARMALDEARNTSPQNAEAWLLSATLYRRQGNLIEAQAKIEQAALLAPSDPEIGLEAGVIAVLGGREDAARRSWKSVQTIAPGTPAAETAAGYLAQLDKP
jgi:tetratricopeptide (TPR) repeat protein